MQRLEGALAAVAQAFHQLIWPEEQSLADALDDAGLSLDDNLIVVDFVAVGPDGGPMRCPVHERDRYLLEPDD